MTRSLRLAVPMFLAACAGRGGIAPPPASAVSAPVRDVQVRVADPQGPAGWYETAPGRLAFVTWAPDGPAYRILDFDAVEFHPLKPRDDGDWTWAVGEDPGRRVKFVRNAAGAVTGFEWIGPDGARGVAPRRDGPFEQVEIRFTNGDVTLKGLVMLPADPFGEKVPGAVFVHGSGDSDRDNVWAFGIAQHLARNGIAVLLPDKRGSGGSGGDWKTADFADLAQDALAAVAALAERPEVNPSRVGIVGLSQGGWIAPLAASTSGDVAFVVDVSGAAVTPGEQVTHEIEQSLRRAGLPDSMVAEAMALHELASAFIRENTDAAWRRYADRREEMMAGPLADVAREFPADRNDWGWPWWRQIIDFDPVPLWAALEAPWLVVYGAEDEQDNVPVARSVALLTPLAKTDERRVRVYEGSGHTLADPEAGWIRRDFLDELADWIGSAGASASR